MEKSQQEELEVIHYQVGVRIASIINDAKKEIDLLLKPYGHKASFDMHLHDLEDDQITEPQKV